MHFDGFEKPIEVAQLRILLKIVETGSFTAAASALRITQPSVSQHVRRVEALVGGPLFRRFKSGVRLTADGNAVVTYARAILGLSSGLKMQLARNAGRFKINIGMPEEFGRTALSGALALFAREHRHVELCVITDTCAKLLKAIEARQVDIAVLRRDPRYPDMPKLWSDELVWLGRDDLDLKATDFVPLCTHIDDPVREMAIAALERAGLRWRIAFESNSFSSVEAALQARLGVGAWPRRMRHMHGERLARLGGLPPLPNVDFVMHAPPSESDPRLLAFAAVLSESAKSGYAFDRR